MQGERQDEPVVDAEATQQQPPPPQEPIWLRRLNSKSSAGNDIDDQDEEELDSLTHLAAPRILRRQDSAGLCGSVAMATGAGHPPCLRSDSTDSIGPELLTFRPIQAMPLTPPGRPAEEAEKTILQPRPLPAAALESSVAGQPSSEDVKDSGRFQFTVDAVAGSSEEFDQVDKDEQS
ncbi:hypothetical protein BOX15_Mlig004880g2 [Macrostomum lignano]|uniref:Uncharacterized protein n=1 Tax=Macrostomum lignano TaxID=282301 RepID=A0A267GLM5_9PLAT|nr:hypothetical protein BOX15_Mlig004880g1 [Macrostomum lignano]PAA86212.1 hypothetical protein BOX15_Mlig004880g2 [Macrostomum lignano]